MQRYHKKPVSVGRVLRNVALIALIIAVFFAVRGASLTPRMALSRTLAGAHFGPYSVEGEFTVPELDSSRKDTRYYLARCEDYFYLAAIDRIGLLWRQEYPNLIGPLPDGIFTWQVDYHPYAKGKPSGGNSILYVDYGTSCAWLVRTTRPEIARVEVTEHRDYEIFADDAVCPAKSLGNGLWLVTSVRPLPDEITEEDDFNHMPTLTLTGVTCYDKGGAVVDGR
ncbi:MAG: hypothetical protein RSE09_06145, partial [Oscillospiraceae bacterium]